jgi:phosphoribosyl 1,2-cyclic phosphodiesterase
LPEPPRTPRATTAQPQFFTPTTRVKFWGVRGSIPVPGSGTVRYGGNTTCVEVRADGEIMILDAGSGIRPLGLALDKEFRDRAMNLTLLITHSHWDHIQGLPFFLPAYQKKNQVRILGYEGARAGLASILAGQMETPYFPINLTDMPGNIAIEELHEMEFNVGKVRVETKFLNHPGVCVGYRLFTSTGSMAFLPDNEPYEMLKMKQAELEGMDHDSAREFARSERQKLVEFLRDCDLLLLDSQYTDDEYEQHVGWGHGSLSSVVSLALDADVRKLILFHHDPNHDDSALDEMLESARHLVVESGKPLEVDAAREGAEVWLGSR